MLSLAQVEAVRSGRLDAGFIVSMLTLGEELDQRPVAQHKIVLAVPKGHPATRQTRLQLRDLNGMPFVCFPRRANPAAYDRLVEACFRGGWKSPRIVQEADDHATILSLVSWRLGVTLVSDPARWHCPRGVALFQIIDLNVGVSFSLSWRRDNRSPLLQRFFDVLWPTWERARIPWGGFRATRHFFHPFCLLERREKKPSFAPSWQIRATQ